MPSSPILKTNTLYNSSVYRRSSIGLSSSYLNDQKQISNRAKQSSNTQQ